MKWFARHDDDGEREELRQRGRMSFADSLNGPLREQVNAILHRDTVGERYVDELVQALLADRSASDLPERLRALGRRAFSGGDLCLDVVIRHEEVPDEVLAYLRDLTPLRRIIGDGSDLACDVADLERARATLIGEVNARYGHAGDRERADIAGLWEECEAEFGRVISGRDQGLREIGERMRRDLQAEQQAFEDIHEPGVELPAWRQRIMRAEPGYVDDQARQHVTQMRATIHDTARDAAKALSEHAGQEIRRIAAAFIADVDRLDRIQVERDKLGRDVAAQVSDFLDLCAHVDAQLAAAEETASRLALERDELPPMPDGETGYGWDPRQGITHRMEIARLAMYRVTHAEPAPVGCDELIDDCRALLRQVLERLRGRHVRRAGEGDLQLQALMEELDAAVLELVARHRALSSEDADLEPAEA